MDPSPLLPVCEDGSCQYVPNVTIRRPDVKPGIIASVFTILLSMPALLGSCCWPVLLAGIGGFTVTAASRQLSHTLSFAITLTILTNLIQYMLWKRRFRSKSPIYLLIFASFLILSDLLRHVFMDAGVIQHMPMYQDGCEPTEGLRGFRCLSLVGWVVTIGFTYTGFATLIVSVLWATDILHKSSLAFSDLRSAA